MLRTAAAALVLLCPLKFLRGHESNRALKDANQFESDILLPVQANLPPSEMEALEELYDSTNGTNWNWKPAVSGMEWDFSDPNANPCTQSWQGITCSDSGGEYRNVIDLSLVKYRLSGSLPNSLSDLTLLESIDLGDNSLTGTIPASFGNWSQLTSLGLISNSLAGSIPASLGNLSQLTYLGVEVNKLTGTIPASLGNLSHLQSLFAGLNYLSGTIPASLGGLSQLLYLDVDTNELSGSIPASFGNLLLLVELYVYTNRLSGKLPASLGNLPQLQVLGGSSNRLSGSIPASFGGLSQMLYMYFQTNELTGTVPSTLGELNHLQGLYLDDNHITGTLPSTLGNCSELLYLTISNNSLVGTIPTTIGDLGLLYQLWLDSNHLTSTIPHSIAKLTALNSFIADHNSLSGSLDGVFDAAVQTNLASIVVNNNQLTGTIPSALFDLPAINTLVASTNCFHGQLPDNVCECVSLLTLVFDGLSSAPACKNLLFPGLSHSYTLESSMHGTIPTCMFQLHALNTLHLSGNEFTGRVMADSTVVSPSLIDLSLSHNQLTGSIPRQLQNKTWTVLDLSFNRLRGSLSSTLAAELVQVNITNIHPTGYAQTSLSLENNRLSGRIPHSVQTLQDVSVLGTNTFSCKLDGSDLPQHDSGVSNYQCGSSEFDVPYYVWLGLCCLSIVLLILQRFGDVNGAVNCCEAWWRCVSLCGVATTGTSGGALHQYKQIKIYFQVLDVVSKHAVVWTAVILVVLLPLYAALSHYYGTYLQAYAWTVSGAYLSGAVPFGLEMALWLAFLTAGMISMLVYCAPRLSSQVAVTLMSPRAHSTGGSSVSHRQLVLIYLLFLSLNIVIVGGVNVAYVYVSIYRSSQLLTFAQICMSFFKVIYNGVASTAMLRYIVGKVTGEKLEPAGYATLRALSALVNNIVIPFAVVMVVSPSCFYFVFTAAPPVSAIFSFENCKAVSASTGACIHYARQPLTSTYDPPFTYSYQCSSSLITYYAPAFVNLCIVSMFVMPILHVLAVEALRRTDKSTRWFQLLNRAVPSTWKLPAVGETSDTTRTYFNPLREQLAQLNFVALIFTFGVVFPPLAAALAMTLVVCTVITKLKLGRLLQHVCDHDGGSIAQSVELACESLLGSALLRDFVGMLSVIACLFYTLFLFDTLGDAVGLHRAYWVLIVVPLLPVCVICAHWALGVSPLNFTGQHETDTSSSGTDQLVAVEMAAVKSIVNGAETFNVILSAQVDAEAQQ